MNFAATCRHRSVYVRGGLPGSFQSDAMHFPSASLIAKMRRFMSRRAFSTTSLGNDNAVERNRSLNDSGDSRPVKPYSSIFTWIAAQSEKSSGINSGVYLGRSIVKDMLQQSEPF